MSSFSVEGKQALINSLVHKDWRLISTACYGRSASIFLSGLLDGHPQILAFPPQEFVFPCRFWKNGEAIETIESVTIDEVIPLLNDGIRYIFTAVHGIELYFPDPELQIERFFAILLEILRVVADSKQRISRRMLFIAMCIAYWVHSGGDLEDLKRKDTLLYGVHVPELNGLDILHRDFRKFYLVYMIREPVNTLTSYIEEYVKKNLLTTASTIAIFKSNFLSGLVPPFMTHDSCFAVKNEALHAYPEKTMRDLATRLGLSWDEILLRHTFDGKDVYWKYSDGVRRIFHEKTRIPRCERSVFSCHDCAMLTTYMHRRYKVWNYQPCPQAAVDQLLNDRNMDCLEYLETLPLPDEARARIMLVLKCLKEVDKSFNYARPLPSAYEHQITCKYKE
jgi:hypothetical protein